MAEPPRPEDEQQGRMDDQGAQVAETPGRRDQEEDRDDDLRGRDEQLRRPDPGWAREERMAPEPRHSRQGSQEQRPHLAGK